MLEKSPHARSYSRQNSGDTRDAFVKGSCNESGLPLIRQSHEESKYPKNENSIDQRIILALDWSNLAS